MVLRIVPGERNFVSWVNCLLILIGWTFAREPEGMKTDEVRDRPLDSFGWTPSPSDLVIVSFYG